MISFLARHGVVDVHYHQCFQVVVSLKNPIDSVMRVGKLLALAEAAEEQRLMDERQVDGKIVLI